MRALCYLHACLRNDLTFFKRSIAAYLHYYSSGVQLHNNRGAAPRCGRRSRAAIRIGEHCQTQMIRTTFTAAAPICTRRDLAAEKTHVRRTCRYVSIVRDNAYCSLVNELTRYRVVKTQPRCSSVAMCRIAGDFIAKQATIPR